MTDAGSLARSIFLGLGQVERNGEGVPRWESVKALEQVLSPFLYYLPSAYYEPGTVLGPELEWQSGETQPPRARGLRVC